MTNNNILIGAEGIDGANFLAACLTMSDKVYFNDGTLQDKKEFYFNRMDNIPEINGLPIWKDVSMLFQSCARHKSQISLGTYQCKDLYEATTLGDRSLISKVHLPLFWPLINLIAKNPDDPLVKLFEPKYFIGLISPDLFISLRTVLGGSELDLTTIADFNLLPKKVQEKFKSDYRTDIDRLFKCEIPTYTGPICDKWDMLNMKCDVDRPEHFYPENRSYKVRSDNTEYYTSSRERIRDIYEKSNELLKSRITHQWDCNWFLTEKETVKNIKLLYSELDLGKCNQTLIRSMYRTWIHRIDSIKKIHIESFCSISINNSMFTI